MGEEADSEMTPEEWLEQLGSSQEQTENIMEWIGGSLSRIEDTLSRIEGILGRTEGGLENLVREQESIRNVLTEIRDGLGSRRL